MTTNPCWILIISMRTRWGFDIITTSIWRRNYKDSMRITLSIRRRILVKTIRISMLIWRRTYKDSMRIRRGFDVIDLTSNPRRNDKDFDVEPIRIRRGFDKDSTLSIRRRILVETIRISMSTRRRNYKDLTRIRRRIDFDVESSSNLYSFDVESTSLRLLGFL